MGTELRRGNSSSFNLRFQILRNCEFGARQALHRDQSNSAAVRQRRRDVEVLESPKQSLLPVGRDITIDLAILVDDVVRRVETQTLCRLAKSRVIGRVHAVVCSDEPVCVVVGVWCLEDRQGSANKLRLAWGLTW